MPETKKHIDICNLIEYLQSKEILHKKLKMQKVAVSWLRISKQNNNHYCGIIINVKKKIIFLDGDGTIWYPKLTKRTQKPHWIYYDVTTKDNYLEHLELTPDAENTIIELTKRGICLVVISANPYAESIAIDEIKERLSHFNISNYFLSVRSSAGDDPKGKARIILEILNALRFNKEDALMVGDSYYYDYEAAKEIGVDAYWVENTVSKFPEVIPEGLKSIKEIHELLEILK